MGFSLPPPALFSTLWTGRLRRARAYGRGAARRCVLATTNTPRARGRFFAAPGSTAYSERAVAPSPLRSPPITMGHGYLHSAPPPTCTVSPDAGGGPFWAAPARHHLAPTYLRSMSAYHATTRYRLPSRSAIPLRSATCRAPASRCLLVARPTTTPTTTPSAVSSYTPLTYGLLLTPHLALRWLHSTWPRPPPAFCARRSTCLFQTYSLAIPDDRLQLTSYSCIGNGWAAKRTRRARVHGGGQTTGGTMGHCWFATHGRWQPGGGQNPPRHRPSACLSGRDGGPLLPHVSFSLLAAVYNRRHFQPPLTSSSLGGKEKGRHTK